MLNPRITPRLVPRFAMLHRGLLTGSGTPNAYTSTATASSTLGAVTLSATGKLAITGTLGTTLGATTASGTGLRDILGSLLTQYESNVDGVSVSETYATSSFNTVANAVQYALVVQSGTTCNLPATLTRNAETWTQFLTNNSGGATVAMGWYRCEAGAASGALTAVFAALDLTTGVHIHVVEFVGADLGNNGADSLIGTNTVSSSATASTGQTVTLPNAMGNARNVHIYAMTHTANEVTASDDFAELGDNAHSAPNRGVSSGWKANDTTAALTWASSQASRWMGFEVKSNTY